MHRMLSVAGILLILLMPFLSPHFAVAQEGKMINLEIIVDASGSMAAATDTGVLRIDAAKRVLNEVIAQIPEAEGVNVGFRVYGHRGNNQPEGQAESCVSSDLLVPMQGVDKAALTAQVNALQPVGWTPLGYALQQAANDFKQPASENVVNAIIMVTDGLETCGADPAAIAGELKNSPADITTHVIGFGTTPEELAILEGITQASGGQLLGSNNAGQLMSSLFTILEELEVVEETGTGETRNSPLGIGRAGRVGDYEVSVISVTPDATSLVNPEAGPPADGYQYFAVRISVTYVGPTSGQPNMDLVFHSVGALGRSYTYFTDVCGPANFPDTVFYAGELFTGGTGEYVVCWQIEAVDAGSLVMYVDTSGQQADRLWLSVGNPIEQPVTSESDVTPTSEAEVGIAPTAQSDQVTNSGSTTASKSSLVLIYPDRLEPGQVAAPANTQVTLTFRNVGSTSCSFVLEYLVPLESTIPPGSETAIETSFPPGRYMFYCTGASDPGGGNTGILIVE